MKREDQIKAKASKIFADEPKTIDIPIEPRNWIEKLLIKYKIKKGFVSYPIRKILYGNRERIASRAVNFPDDIITSGNVLEALFKASLEINDDLLYIAAVAVQNDRYEPSKALLDQLKWVDDSVFADILDKSLSMFDLQSFMKSIVLIKGTVLTSEKRKTSLQDTREMIARGEESKVTADTLE